MVDIGPSEMDFSPDGAHGSGESGYTRLPDGKLVELWGVDSYLELSMNARIKQIAGAIAEDHPIACLPAGQKKST